MTETIDKFVKELVGSMTELHKVVEQLAATELPTLSRKLGSKPLSRKAQTLLKSLQDEVEAVVDQKQELTDELNFIVTTSKDIIPPVVDACKTFIAVVDKTLSVSIEDYQSAVKNTDGLTTLRPAVMQALQAASKDPSADRIKRAADALMQHIADAKKEAGFDKTKVKAFKEFSGQMEKIKADLNELR